jgi:type I restriction enzyme, S subunit
MKAKSAGWKEISLGKILRHLDERVTMDDEREYLTITVKRRHGGLEIRERLFGHQIATKKQFRLVPGAFIVSRVQCWHQAYAIVGDVPANTIASTNYDQFGISPEVDSRFFWWLSHSPEFTETVRSSAVGVVIEKMVFNRDEWLTKSVRLPPLPEQRRIVARIEELAAQLHEARTLRHQAAEEAEALPLSKLGAVFTREAEQRGTTRLEELLLDAGYGSSEKCDTERVEGATPVLRIPNVASERISLSDLKYAHLSKRDTEKLLLSEGEVLVVRTNGSLDLVGRSAVVPKLEEPFAFASYMIRLRFDQARIAPDYAQRMLRHLRVSGALVDFARTTAGQYNVSLGRLRAAEIPVPPVTNQRRIVAELDALQAEVDALKSLQAETAAELDALLPSILDKAFKGEL